MTCSPAPTLQASPERRTTGLPAARRPAALGARGSTRSWCAWPRGTNWGTATGSAGARAGRGGAGLRLVTQQHADQIRAVAEQRTAAIPDSDLAVLGYGEWLAGLQRGIAAHHAGLLPTFKEEI